MCFGWVLPNRLILVAHKFKVINFNVYKVILKPLYELKLLMS